MQPKLRLVREFSQPRERASAPREDRFRYPAHEEIWEVSCGPDGEEEERPTLANDQRRAG